MLVSFGSDNESVVPDPTTDWAWMKDAPCSPRGSPSWVPDDVLRATAAGLPAGFVLPSVAQPGAPTAAAQPQAAQAAQASVAGGGAGLLAAAALAYWLFFR